MMYPRSSRMPTGRRRPSGIDEPTLKSGYEVFHEDLSSVTNLVGKLDIHRRRRGYSWLRSQGKTKACVCACACSRTRVRDVYWGVEEKIGSVTDTWCDDARLARFLTLLRGLLSETKKEPGFWETRKKWRRRRRGSEARDRGRGSTSWISLRFLGAAPAR